jgi:amino acid transporter
MQSMTHLAPAVSLLFAFPFIVAFAGVATPLAFAIAFVIVVMLGAALTRLAAAYPSAGGYYEYARRALGERAAFLTGWMYVLYSPILPASVLAFLGYVVERAVRAEYGVRIPWWTFVIGGAAVAAAAGVRGVRVAVVVLVVVGALEMAIVAALAAWGAAQPGPGGDSFLPLSPGAATTSTGLYLGVVFSIGVYAGWEAAAPLAEESTRPRRNVPIAILASIMLMGAFMTLCSWGLVLGWGTRNVAGIARSPELPAFALAHRYWGAAWLVVLAALANSAAGVAVACNNVASRMWYGMAREGGAPRALARLHPRYGTPAVAVVVQSSLAVVLGLSLGFWLGPYGELLVIGLVTTISFTFVYVVGNLALVVRSLRRRGADPVLSLVFPILSSGALVWAIFKALHPLPRYPADWAPAVVAVWVVIGLALLVLGRGVLPESHA